MRSCEDGNFFVADAFVIPREETGLVARIAAAQRAACDSDWRLRELMVMPVRELPRWPDESG